MKRDIIILLAVVLFVTVKGASNKSDGCAIVCRDIYEPLCAGGPGGDITFGNECVLRRFNCEHKDKQYTKKSDKECPNNAPVRLQ